MASGLPPYYPPDIGCWWDPDLGAWDQYQFQSKNCSITDNMVNFLNLTGATYTRYFEAYCVHPPAGDNCPFGFCPNPDIAGLLVRVATYITEFCFAILILYSPTSVKEAFWSQILLTYSLLLTCGFSLLHGEVTQYHANFLVSLVCSPVSVYLTGYAIRASWGTHRLGEVLGTRKYLERGLVFLSVAIWFAILIYAQLPPNTHRTRFAQDSCSVVSTVEGFFLVVPFYYAWFLSVISSTPTQILTLALFFTIPALVIVSWVVAIVLKKDEIWPSGEPFRPRFCAVWRRVATDYPFIQFMSVVAVPAVYWISCVEIGLLWGNGNDNEFSLTFGQVIALFASLPPVIQVSKLSPRLRDWAKTLSWVLWIKKTWSKRNAGRREKMSSSTTESIEEKKQVDDNSLDP